MKRNNVKITTSWSKHYTWWSHQMETISALLAICADRWIAWWRYKMETFSALLASVRRIHRSPVNSPHKGQWQGALVFSLICIWINGSVNNRGAGDLRRHRAHHDVIVMVPGQRPVKRSFDVFFDLRLNKRLSKQWWGWWFEKLSRPLWRHCNYHPAHTCSKNIKTMCRFLEIALFKHDPSWSHVLSGHRHWCCTITKNHKVCTSHIMIKMT